MKPSDLDELTFDEVHTLRAHMVAELRRREKQQRNLERQRRRGR